MLPPESTGELASSREVRVGAVGLGLGILEIDVSCPGAANTGGGAGVEKGDWAKEAGEDERAGAGAW